MHVKLIYFAKAKSATPSAESFTAVDYSSVN